MADQSLPSEGKSYFSLNILIFVKDWVFESKFGSRCARKPINGSEESDHRLVSKQNLSQKWLVALAPRDR